MTKEQLQLIQEHLNTVLTQRCVIDELNHFIENNAILDEDGEEIDLNSVDFQWSLDLKLSCN
jgi:hypothetical protein